MMLMMVLGAILYGVYVVLNKGPAPEPPPGVARDWAKPVEINLGTAEDDKGGPPPMPAMRPSEPKNSAAGQGPNPTATYPPPGSNPRGAASPSVAGQEAGRDQFASGAAPPSDAAKSAAPLFTPPREAAAGAIPRQPSKPPPRKNRSPSP